MNVISLTNHKCREYITSLTNVITISCICILLVFVNGILIYHAFLEYLFFITIPYNSLYIYVDE